MTRRKPWRKLSEHEKHERFRQEGRDSWLAGMPRKQNRWAGNIAFLDWDQGWCEARDEYAGGKRGAESPKIR